jgi:hypothetical protein
VTAQVCFAGVSDAGEMNDEQNVYNAPAASRYAEGTVVRPKRKPPRPYFARLDPRRNLTEQIAARIVQRSRPALTCTLFRFCWAITI